MTETKEQQAKCYFIAKENFTAERYSVFIQDDYFVLIAENGEFNLTERALKQTIENWKNVVDVKKAGAK